MRGLTPLNRLYTYYERILNRRGSNANSCEWLVLSREPDAARLAEACRLVAQRHPVLRARLRRGPFGLRGWTADAPAEPRILVHRFDGPLPQNAPDTLMSNVWEMPLDLYAGPPWRIVLNVFSDRCVLQIVTSHVFTDGKSANRVVRDLLLAYDATGPAVDGHEPAFDATPVDQADRDLGRLYLAHLPLGARLGAAMRSLWNIAAEACHRPLRPRWRSMERGRTRVLMRDLGPAPLAALRAACKREGISRHPFLVGAFSAATVALTRALGGPRMRDGASIKLIDNFSVREMANADISELYELAAIPYSISVALTENPEADFRKGVVAQIDGLRRGKIRDEIMRYRLYHAMALPFPKLLSTKMVLASIVKTDLFLSNVGPVPDEVNADRSLGVVEYFSFSQLFPPGRLMLFISTAGDSLRLVCLWDDRALYPEDVTEVFLRRFEEALLAQAKQSSDAP